MVGRADGCRHLTMSSWDEGGKESMNYLFEVLKNMKQWKQNSRGGNFEHTVAHVRSGGVSFFCKTLSGVHFKGTSILSPNDSDKSHLSSRSQDKI